MTLITTQDTPLLKPACRLVFSCPASETEFAASLFETISEKLHAEGITFALLFPEQHDERAYFSYIFSGTKEMLNNLPVLAEKIVRDFVKPQIELEQYCLDTAEALPTDTDKLAYFEKQAEALGKKYSGVDLVHIGFSEYSKEYSLVEYPARLMLAEGYDTKLREWLKENQAEILPYLLRQLNADASINPASFDVECTLHEASDIGVHPDGKRGYPLTIRIANKKDYGQRDAFLATVSPLKLQQELGGIVAMVALKMYLDENALKKSFTEVMRVETPIAGKIYDVDPTSLMQLSGGETTFRNFIKRLEENGLVSPRAAEPMWQQAPLRQQDIHSPAMSAEPCRALERAAGDAAQQIRQFAQARFGAQEAPKKAERTWTAWAAEKLQPLSKAAERFLDDGSSGPGSKR